MLKDIDAATREAVVAALRGAEVVEEGSGTPRRPGASTLVWPTPGACRRWPPTSRR
ncbi:hypothetical protein [Baekduia soli]|uniref:hypothetical protein n=1 Tax=Baekduia soli TaxID=496014 RepID=UPI001652AA2E|nr:hypothetical protein [Baekduia soli]